MLRSVPCREKDSITRLKRSNNVILYFSYLLYMIIVTYWMPKNNVRHVPVCFPRIGDTKLLQLKQKRQPGVCNESRLPMGEMEPGFSYGVGRSCVEGVLDGRDIGLKFRFEGQASFDAFAGMEHSGMSTRQSGSDGGQRQFACFFARYMTIWRASLISRLRDLVNN